MLGLTDPPRYLTSVQLCCVHLLPRGAWNFLISRIDSLAMTVLSPARQKPDTGPFGPNPDRSILRLHFLRFTNPCDLSRVGLLGHNEAYCEDNYLVGGYLCHVDWSPGDVRSSTKSDLVATNIFHCFAGMLWIANGWHRPNALSNLSSRGIVVAAGRC
ncbi:hypothetical protein NL676_002789 [Syzygium grande]|nr:hypothetical protein NL676_002789 [Syzygium grande]